MGPYFFSPKLTLSNPPFVGYTYQTLSQKEDLKALNAGLGNNIDYVAGWYVKASQLMQGTTVRTAFVSTNSITQGEQVAAVWKPLFNNFGIHIDFAYRTFRWDSEASIQAHVHCVIVGFSTGVNDKSHYLFANESAQLVDNINAYLCDASNVFIEPRTKPLCNVPVANKGSQPTDGGFLIIKSTEYDDFVASEPSAIPYLRVFLGSDEFINGKKRYCLWLKDAQPNELSKMPLVLSRIKGVKEFRLNSKKAATQKWADMPTLFTENRQPQTNYIAIPEVSSGNRRYIPMGFLTPEIVCSNKIQAIPDATLYHFGILMSNIHMGWTRAVCGRLKSDYDYSAKIVYNNFPWPTPTPAQKARIEQTAQDILDARALYPDCSLADLYDEVTMPAQLRRAHQQNDKAVMDAYGFVKGTPEYGSEAACVAALMRMYQALTNA